MRPRLIAAIIFIICISIIILFAPSVQNNADDDSIVSLYMDDDQVIVFNGESSFDITPSSISIYFNEEDGSRCAIHLLNYNKLPEKGIYDVENDQEVKTASLCAMGGVEDRERIISDSGTFTIYEINEQLINGYIDIIMVGGDTGRQYTLSGEFTSTSENFNMDA